VTVEDKKKRGRPQKDIVRDSYIKVRITSKQKEELRFYAERNGLTMSRVVEMALSSFMFDDFE